VGAAGPGGGAAGYQDTLFAIGSATKAFTATTVGALVDEGLLEWDRPLRDYVPGVRLHDPFVSDRLTIVDLLSHRSGLPRHDLTWVGQPGRSRAEIVHCLRFLPLSRDLRQEFQYCNLGYLAAGHVVEALSGVPWEDFVRGRLLGPLGMRRSNLSVDEMLADADHAAAYTRRDGVIVPVPQRPLPAMAPAGAINSSAADMARWLLAQLAGGQLDGVTVMSAGTAKRQLTPHMLMPDSGEMPGLTQYAYGLGWAIGRYREHTTAMHAGGIDGFATHCMLLPDDGIGVAVLTNTSASLMHLVVACRVLDELLGAEPLDVFGFLKPRFDAGMAGIREAKAVRRVVPGAPPARPLSAYAGEYEHPGYGTFTIALDGDTLKPSLGTMDLSLVHRHYETFDLTWHEMGDQPVVFPLTFLSDPDGDINALTRWADRGRDRLARRAHAHRHRARQPAFRPRTHRRPPLRREGPASRHGRVRTRRQRHRYPPHSATSGNLRPQGSKLTAHTSRRDLACCRDRDGQPAD
jgi:CubicO group peptidase (beta-lactamase class C family)